jgi:hypothetical protein
MKTVGTKYGRAIPENDQAKRAWKVEKPASPQRTWEKMRAVMLAVPGLVHRALPWVRTPEHPSSDDFGLVGRGLPVTREAPETEKGGVYPVIRRRWDPSRSVGDPANTLAAFRNSISLRLSARFGQTQNMNDDFIVARYLFDKRQDGRYVPKVQVRWHAHPENTIVITDAEGRTYGDLNTALEMDLWLLNTWKAKHAPTLVVVIESVVIDATVTV